MEFSFLFAGLAPRNSSINTCSVVPSFTLHRLPSTSPHFLILTLDHVYDSGWFSLFLQLKGRNFHLQIPFYMEVAEYLFLEWMKHRVDRTDGQMEGRMIPS